VILQLPELRVGQQRPIATFGTNGHAARFRVAQDHELLRSAHGERAHENAAEQAEDCGIRPDAKRERQHRDGCESGASGKDAQGVTEVLFDHVTMLPQSGW
jgi:hypothetical protein